MTEYTRTADLAERLRETLHASERFFRTSPQTAWVAERYFACVVDNALTQGSIVPLPPDVADAMDLMSPSAQREVAFTAQDVAVRRLWQEARIVYDVDFDAWESIGAAESTSTVPAQVLDALPHPNPLLIFPESVVLDHGEKERQRVVGVFVNGAREIRPGGELTPCSTHHPDVTGWTLTFCGLVEDSQGRPVMYDTKNQDVMWTRSTVRLDRQGSGNTLGSIVERAIVGFDAIRGRLAIGDHRQDLPLLLSRAVHMLIYLGAANVDLQPLPASRGGRTRPTGDRKPAKVIAVGHRVGAQLRAWRRSEQTSKTATGRTVKPHIRRSHAHTFRRGPGRQETFVKWLWPIPVNMRPGGATETTIIPIKES